MIRYVSRKKPMAWDEHGTPLAFATEDVTIVASSYTGLDRAEAAIRAAEALMLVGLPYGHPDKISLRTAMERVGVEDIDATLDTMRHDEGDAGGSSGFRGLLPAGATVPEDEKR